MLHLYKYMPMFSLHFLLYCLYLFFWYIFPLLIIFIGANNNYINLNHKIYLHEKNKNEIKKKKKKNQARD